ncbi:MAG: hypothetical protein IPK26_04640 [Planctomycetes bacterium]|nr:hypothetical protein [Planctomycetota bacterium]
MNLRHLFLSAFSASVLLTAANAQVRTNAFNATLGNANCGGAVHAHATTSRDSTVLRTLATAEANLRGNVNILGATTEAGEVLLRGSSMVSNFLPSTRSGLFRIEMRGAVVASAAAAGSVAMTTRTLTYTAFAADPARAIAVGPVTMTVRGNANCTLTTGGSVNVPVASATVTMNGNATMVATPRFSTSFSAPGMTAGVATTGSIYNQTLVTSSGVSNLGFSGSTSYLLRAIALRVDLSLQVLLFAYRVNLVNFSRAVTSLMLI